MNKSLTLTLAALMTCISLPTRAAPMDLANTPLFLTDYVTPLTMLVMGRDHKLYYEAYNDASDLNGDGVLDIRFNPDIDYFGYFDSYKCYNYGGGKFTPASVTANKKCGGNWSGNWLNYVTTSRMDALRGVFFGGYRFTDSVAETVLERAYIPQDAHSWGKEYRSTAVDGYNISEYTPLGQPAGTNYHLFANTTLLGTTTPLLRVAYNQPYRIWEWVSIERPVAGSRVLNGGSGPNISASITDYTVRVKVCDPAVGLETNCRQYSNSGSPIYKPTGILQDFGENDAMHFGLLTGSYGKNLSGGMLRKNIGTLTDEIDSNTGIITSTTGIIGTINRFTTTGFGGHYYYNSNCGWITTRNINSGECRMWGNPIGEMMYETLRYFAGKSNPTANFVAAGGDDAALGLPSPAWVDPYAGTTPYCAKPNMIVISDVNPSFDSDEVPGSYFSGFGGDLTGLSVSTLGATLWAQETPGGMHFIGQSAAVSDGAPTAKAVNSFGNIRGLAPEEPNKEGSYSSSAIAYYGRITDMSSAYSDQKVYTYAIALASPLPEINIPVNGKVITLVPFAKSVGGSGINAAEGAYQPTNTIVDFYVETLGVNTGTFRINFEDVSQGADHDMDAIVKYTYTVNGDGTVTIDLVSEYAAGGIIQHMGYVISGTTADGVYLEVRDVDTAAGSDPDYYLDTPRAGALPLVASRTFTPSATPAATLLKNPLWYAAKYGSFTDTNDNNLPDQQGEFDADANGVPDNYFLVTNATTLKTQLTAAIGSIVDRSGSFSSASLSSGFLNSTTKLYQAIFKTLNWQGQLLAYSINVTTGAVDYTGTGPNGSQWDAGTILAGKNYDTHRKIITYKPSSGVGIPFRWPVNPASPSSTELDVAQSAILSINPQTAAADGQGENRLNYLRGQTTNEEQNGGIFRARTTPLGDIIQSNPILIGAPKFNYPETWPNTGFSETSYSAFKASNVSRTPILYVGSNDGMLHAFDAATGEELFAYVPNAVFNNLTQLTSPDYSHRYYVDGSPNSADVFFSSSNQWRTVLTGGLNAGGQGIYTLDITDPSTFAEAQANTVSKWEFTDADDSDLGFTFGMPSIVRMQNGQWAAIFGSGYNNTYNLNGDVNVSATGNAVLFIVDIETGTLIKKIDTGVGLAEDPLGLSRPNGLSSPAVVDMDGDSVADYAYAGDLFGNIWKFDLSTSNTSQWKVAIRSGSTPMPLFTAKDASGNNQAITSSPTVSKIQSTGRLQLYFGTGKYLENSDKVTDAQQTFYAIQDDFSDTQITGRAQLLQQEILQSTDGLRVTTTHQMTGSEKGWYMDLEATSGVPSERIISDAIYLNSKIIFTTIIPSSDPCEYGGTSWLMEMNAEDGARLGTSPFDLNNDGVFDSADNASYSDGSGGSSVPPSGMQSTVGLVTAPAILNAGSVEHKYLSGSTGQIDHIVENPGAAKVGRQSWRQIR